MTNATDEETEIKSLRQMVEQLSKEVADLKESLEVLRRYHWGDGSISRETVTEVLSKGAVKCGP